MKLRAFILLIFSIIYTTIVFGQNGPIAIWAGFQTLTSQPTVHDEIDKFQKKVLQLQKEHPQEALQLIHAHLETTLSPKDQAVLYDLQGNCYKLLGDIAASIQAYNNSIAAYAGEDHIAHIISIKNKIGWLKIKEGKYEAARVQFNEGLALAQQENLIKKIGDNYNDIGDTIVTFN